MDHSHMDHSGMDHGGHGGGGMDDMCSMSMLFTWDTKNLCLIFRQWHVRSLPSLIFSLLAVILIAMGYEALRAYSRQYEASLAKQVETMPSDQEENHNTETTPFLRPGQNRAQANQRGHVIKGVLYGLQNFYALMLMLFFMTYNGWVMISVSLGAFFGYLLFGANSTATKDGACH